ncbi:efflux RND transporter periplasmic adaptor subunit [Gemmobacter fulvus]|uniref:Efflux RND transporter periplasmic adaptor subunit n=1 Tax=Gemmobacter fulvus TaxID=2840474 RepID=A0A975P8J7_9RHOB|nr:efflux RND transporter periplasmic adaptor subunit [Gemmobacter fulvus]MBT9244508.1 efflux RND transporter periplasmic adaptor subunit [Gemmobacter fulvus]QWK91377.1 efflux RND transporter periplasmic adaptor subunit [Gemmobacter fulvus]
MLRILILATALATPLAAEPLALTQLTEWKAVYGRIEARDRLPARARIGGTLVTLTVAEGDSVTAGQELGRIVDDKLGFQLSAVDAQIEALTAQLTNAQTELQRGEDLLKRGVSTAQRLDALRTQVDVVSGQIAAQTAQRKVLEQQAAEGRVIAPVAGRVLDVPQAAGAVVLPGEAVALIGGGGFFLRLAVPERHATHLHQGDIIQIETPTGPAQGTLARLYPLIENGRVLADVDVPGLPDGFVDARVVVRLPVAQRSALLVPAHAITSRAGLDFVTLTTPDGPVARVVVPGQRQDINGATMVEILSGLQEGDEIGAVE